MQAFIGATLLTSKETQTMPLQRGWLERSDRSNLIPSGGVLYPAGPVRKRAPGWGSGVATRLDHRADRIGLLRLSGAAQVNESPERWTDRCLSPALLTPRPSGDHLPGSQMRRQPRGSASTRAHAALLWRIYQNASRGMRHLVRHADPRLAASRHPT